ncbi:MAG: class I SAM-dependent methyltransferase [Gammaproteobacteria bacterium]|nr:MAG: class I SAM-dependent methyltransferase [Gammaproteobacteria bacterium]
MSRCSKGQTAGMRDLAAWYGRGTGRRTLQGLDALLEPGLARAFGYHGLWLGLPPAAPTDLRRHAPIRHQIWAGPAGGALRCRFEALPFAAESVDLVVLFHALELSRDPHALLREVDRILVPEGQVLVVHFHPWSWYGLWQLGGRLSGRMPWCLKAYSRQRVADWLKLLGYACEAREGTAFVPPLGWARLQPVLARMDRTLGRWPGLMPAVSLLRARKQVAAVRPLPLRWPLPARALAGVKIPGPTTRSAARVARRSR